MRVFVEAAGVLAPGLTDWEHSKAVLAGEQPFRAVPLAPVSPASLAAAERRRSSEVVRLAIAAAEQALQRSTRAPQELAMVFSSREAAGDITHQLCEVLAGSREVSPTQFHNSVHNAPSGYYSIALGAKLAACSLCHGRWSFAAGLLGAAVQAIADGLPVLYVCYDSPMPWPLREAIPIVDSTAIALILAPAAAQASIATWELALEAGDGEAAWPSWVPASWHANASARGFAALATLCDPACRVATLPLSPDLNLRVSRC